MKQPKLEFYQDAAGEWRWRLIAPNGKIIAESGEGYIQRSSAVNGAMKTMKTMEAFGSLISGAIKPIHTEEVPRQQLESIPDQELIAKARAALSKMCQTGGSSFTMSVPPRLDDTDIILDELIRRYEEATDTGDKQEGSS